MNLSKIAALVSAATLALAPAAFAGSVGSQSTNTFGRETYSGRNWSSSVGETQEHINGITRSSSGKAEFLVPAGQEGRVQAQFGSSSTAFGSTAYCNASANVDPACLTSATSTEAVYSKTSNVKTTGGSEGHFSGVVDTITAESSSSF